MRTGTLMDRTELAEKLDGLARGALSDAATRAINAGDVRVSPLPVRTPVIGTARRGLGRRGPTTGVVETTGVNAWRFDDSTAVALARGGLLLRDSAEDVFRPASAAELADARDEQTLTGYLRDAEVLMASVSGGADGRPFER